MTNDRAPARAAKAPDGQNALAYVRPDIRKLSGYAPGEQRPGIIKLNTNECAYDPSPRVRQALLGISEQTLRLYPDPSSRLLREAAAARFSVEPEQVLAGNGSDDCLTILFRTFLAPGELVACPWPTYGLYDTLASLQGAGIRHLDYRRTTSRWDLPDGLAEIGAKLVLVANPNNPSSVLTPTARLRQLADQLKGILIVDEAYVDFAIGAESDASMLPHLDAHSNVVVLRSFSKSYGLAGARLGLAFASAALVAEMNKVKDSYNVNAVTQVLGIAALDDRAYCAKVIARTLAEKARLERELAAFGWTWPEARGNFLLCEVGPRAREIFRALSAEDILIRYWDTPALCNSLRISVGSPEQNQALLTALRSIV